MSKTRTAVFFTATLLIHLTGCAGVTKVHYSPLANIDRPPRSIDQVAVFITQRPKKPYAEVGVLSYRAGTAEKYTEIVQYMREKAAQLGVDAIIILGSSTGPGMQIGQILANLTDYRAMAIVYTE